MTPPKKGSPNRRGVARREQILDAAVELFAERGFRATGLQQLADRVGVSHVAILHHFGTKENLLRAVMARREQAQAEVVGEWNEGGIKALTGAGHGGSLLEPAVLTRLAMVLLAENFNRDDPLHGYFVEQQRTVRELIATDIRAGQERGEFRRDIDAEVKAVEVLAFIIGVEAQWLLDPEPIDLQAVFASFGQSLLADLAGAGPPGDPKAAPGSGRGSSGPERSTRR